MIYLFISVIVNAFAMDLRKLIMLDRQYIDNEVEKIDNTSVKIHHLPVN
jgi:hypothetical protein